MRTSRLVMMALLGLTGWVQAESVSIVQVTDMRGQVEYRVMSRDDLAKIQKEIKEETAVYPAVVAECKKEWDANKDNKLPFQGSRIKPRSAKKGLDFSDKAKAEAKCDVLQKRADKSEGKKEEKNPKQTKGKDEELKKEEDRAKAFETAFEMITTKMGEKLKRAVESNGLSAFTPKDGEKKDAAKKEEPKKDEKKKEEPKKDEKKAGK